jgi:hypothetical protein
VPYNNYIRTLIISYISTLNIFNLSFQQQKNIFANILSITIPLLIVRVVLSEMLLAVSDTVSNEDCPKSAELGDVSPDVMEAELFSSNSPCWRSAELLS